MLKHLLYLKLNTNQIVLQHIFIPLCKKHIIKHTLVCISFFQTASSLVRVLCYRFQGTKRAARIGGSFCVLVGLTGLEPATSSSRTKRSTRLNYNPKLLTLLHHFFYIATIIFKIEQKSAKAMLKYFYSYATNNDLTFSIASWIFETSEPPA